MASYMDPWVREYNEACKPSNDISSMISVRGSYGSGPEGQRHSSAIRRKITILGTRLDSLQTLLSKLPAQQPVQARLTCFIAVVSPELIIPAGLLIFIHGEGKTSKGLTVD
ncbi:hypothetical protein Tco_0668255 [Tanacetum coccineum]